jgi:hypothetical protein
VILIFQLLHVSVKILEFKYMARIPQSMRSTGHHKILKTTASFCLASFSILRSIIEPRNRIYCDRFSFDAQSQFRYTLSRKSKVLSMTWQYAVVYEPTEVSKLIDQIPNLDPFSCPEDSR